MRIIKYFCIGRDTCIIGNSKCAFLSFLLKLFYCFSLILLWYSDGITIPIIESLVPGPELRPFPCCVIYLSHIYEAGTFFN